MKAYKVEVLVLDFENYGEEQINLMLGNVRGLACSVQDIQKADIGSWNDDNPLNRSSTAKDEYQRLFGLHAAVSAAPSGEVDLSALRRFGAGESDPDVCERAGGEFVLFDDIVAAITATKE